MATASTTSAMPSTFAAPPIAAPAASSTQAQIVHDTCAPRPGARSQPTTAPASSAAPRTARAVSYTHLTLPTILLV